MASEKPAHEELNVSAIRDGTVIDHIHNEATFKVAQILRLEQTGQMVLVGMNLPSAQVGRKGIVKIEGRELTAQEVDGDVCARAGVAGDHHRSKI